MKIKGMSFMFGHMSALAGGKMFNDYIHLSKHFSDHGIQEDGLCHSEGRGPSYKWQKNKTKRNNMVIFNLFIKGRDDRRAFQMVETCVVKFKTHWWSYRNWIVTGACMHLDFVVVVWDTCAITGVRKAKLSSHSHSRETVTEESSWSQGLNFFIYKSSIFVIMTHESQNNESRDIFSVLEGLFTRM